MDIEKLIDRLYTKQQSYDSYTDSELAHVMEDAITALSTLQAENEKLRAESIMHHNAADNYFAELTEYRQERNEALAELEQVKVERDAVVESIPHECKTCIYYTISFNGCTPDHDCTNPDGGCSNNYDRWEWRGQKEE